MNTLDISSHGRLMPFAKVSALVVRKRRAEKLPAAHLSHSLSICDSGKWLVRDTSGEDVALVSEDGRVGLIG